MEFTSPVHFEPVGNVTNVFFDDKNQQVFSVRSGGTTGILVRGPSEFLCSTFRVDEDKGQIFSIKLSPDQKILAIQRAKSRVDFIGVNRLGPNGALDERGEYSQSSRGKHSTILGFAWTGVNEIVFFTEADIEIYHVVPERRLLKNVRNQNQNINWFVFCPRTSMLVTATASAASSIQPFLIKGSYIHKLPKIEYSESKENKAIIIRERDVYIVTLYQNATFIAVFIHARGKGTSIHLHSVNKDHTVIRRTHLLKLGIPPGPFALNVVDHLIAIHHQASSSTYLFDVSNSDNDSNNNNNSAAEATSLCVVEPVTENPISILNNEECKYGSHWATFQPNLLVDAKKGVMWRLKLKLLTIVKDIPKLSKIVSFLLQREGAKMVCLDILYERCLEKTDLSTMAEAFDLINDEYRLHLDAQMLNHMALPVNFSPIAGKTLSSNPIKSNRPAAKVILDQSDIYTNIFSRFGVEEASLMSPPPLSAASASQMPINRQIAMVLEYFRSLREHRIPVQQYLNELLINLLVQNESWYQLHQLLQYHVISDSKPVSCLLLSLENVYKPAGQLALDMLARLGTAEEEICEILLSKKMILPALKFISCSSSNTDSVPPRKFLEAALDSGDKLVFYSIYKFFENRNLQLKGSKKFLPSDRCQTFVNKFQEMFPNDDKISA